VLSRNGERMSVTFEGGYGSMATLTVSDPSRYTWGGPQGAQKGAFNGFLDDDRTLLSVYDNWLSDPNDPHNGQIRVYDANTGTVDDSREVPIGPGRRATHVDVAPDGRSIVYVDYADLDERPIREAQGSVRVISYEPATQHWGTPRTVVPFDGTVNNYYPTFSPDGQWILFNRAVGSAYDNPMASVWVVPADGSRPPVELVHANRAANLTNSWPRWAPFVVDSEFGTTRMWFTFTSKRDYGLRLVGTGRPQIWMAAFDPLPTLAGADGSSPAFWLPFQDLSTRNHTATWTTRIVPRNCERNSDCREPAEVCSPTTRTCETAPIPG
jgi:hypothetical protein